MPSGIVRSLVAVAVVVALGAAVATAQNDMPVIGILSMPLSATEGCVCEQTSYGSVVEDPALGSCLVTYYKSWIEQAGARVAILPYDAPRATMDAFLEGVNGILFTGGALSLSNTTTYVQTAQYLLDYIIDQYNNDVYVPLHGTCLGSQLLATLVAGTDTVVSYPFDSYGISLPLDFTAAAKSSHLFGSAPSEIYDIFATQNVTSNLHHAGVTPDTYASNPKLAEFFTVLSTNTGIDGKEFVSTAEGTTYPVTLSQWHPERPQFEWEAGIDLNHSPDAVAAMAYMANFLVSEARKNALSFTNATTETNALIYHYPSKYVPGEGGAQTVYFIPPFSNATLDA